MYSIKIEDGRVIEVNDVRNMLFTIKQVIEADYSKAHTVVVACGDLPVKSEINYCQGVDVRVVGFPVKVLDWALCRSTMSIGFEVNSDEVILSMLYGNSDSTVRFVWGNATKTPVSFDIGVRGEASPGEDYSKTITCGIEAVRKGHFRSARVRNIDGRVFDNLNNGFDFLSFGIERIDGVYSLVVESWHNKPEEKPVEEVNLIGTDKQISYINNLLNKRALKGFFYEVFAGDIKAGDVITALRVAKTKREVIKALSYALKDDFKALAA